MFNKLKYRRIKLLKNIKEVESLNFNFLSDYLYIYVESRLFKDRKIIIEQIFNDVDYQKLSSKIDIIYDTEEFKLSDSSIKRDIYFKNLILKVKMLDNIISKNKISLKLSLDFGYENANESGLGTLISVLIPNGRHYEDYTIETSLKEQDLELMEEDIFVLNKKFISVGEQLTLTDYVNILYSDSIYTTKLKDIIIQYNKKSKVINSYEDFESKLLELQ